MASTPAIAGTQSTYSVRLAELAVFFASMSPEGCAILDILKMRARGEKKEKNTKTPLCTGTRRHGLLATPVLPSRRLSFPVSRVFHPSFQLSIHGHWIALVPGPVLIFHPTKPHTATMGEELTEEQKVGRWTLSLISWFLSLSLEDFLTHSLPISNFSWGFSHAIASNFPFLLRIFSRNRFQFPISSTFSKIFQWIQWSWLSIRFVVCPSFPLLS